MEKYIERCIKQYLSKWYNLQKNFISLQSYDIFISMVESLVMLVIAHREYYLQFPFYHGNMELKHWSIYLEFHEKYFLILIFMSFLKYNK